MYLCYWVFVFIFHYSPVESAIEIPVNVTVNSQKKTEPSISDFQDFVFEMQKTITGLRKQVCASSSSPCYHELKVLKRVVFVELKHTVVG